MAEEEKNGKERLVLEIELETGRKDDPERRKQRKNSNDPGYERTDIYKLDIEETEGEPREDTVEKKHSTGSEKYGVDGFFER